MYPSSYRYPLGVRRVALSSVVLGLGTTISSREVLVLDANSEALGVKRLQLMENAGAEVARAIVDKVRGPKRVVVFAGTGGNAGDGFVAARHLAYHGYSVTVVTVKSPSEIKSEEAKIMYDALVKMDYSIELIEAPPPDTYGDLLENSDIVIDALLGVGIRGAPRYPYDRAIRAINNADKTVFAIDTPSGLDTDSGDAPGEVVKADYTITFHKPKPGLLKRRDVAGEVIVASIGIPPEAEIYAGPGDVLYRLPKRKWSTRKGRAGRVLVIGGSRDYVGAPILAAFAAEAAGVDLVFIAGPPNVVSSATAKKPTLIPVRLEEDYLSPRSLDKLLPFIEKVDAIAIGMGLGLAEETRELVYRVLEHAEKHNVPVVVDADGLKHLKARVEILHSNMVITPHDKEFETLFNTEPGPMDCPLKRVEATAREAAKHKGVTILLKGPIDVVSNGSKARLNRTGAPSMSVGGSGDTLAGLVAAMLAKKLDPFNAALLAAYINGAAGALAYKEKLDYMTALDIVEKIPQVLKDPLGTAGHSVIYYRLSKRKC